ncbi:hypothetical protein GRI38_11025 [Altererythrobacter aurantiacus]|uniref:Protein ImuA n=1 Tax=Parapontixanthobacter aurantiacus TaxID=1463599 RepID=A0A844ZHD7_9SPHN|nr:hypothetical protein [Parapontixanthobacter aurantiacus]MXO86556.1 hypothetical protein [Parapontixanthobacter aurantiacus]
MDEPRFKHDISLVSNDNFRDARDLVDDSIGDSTARPILPFKPQLVELFGHFRDAGVAGFALAQIPAGGRVLWVQERMVALETGRPFGQAFARFRGDPDNLVLACSRNTTDLLWTMEEGLKNCSLSAIIGEIWGDPRVLDFTATKRLAMRAERRGVRVFLIRFQGHPDLSAARQRWNIHSLPSAPHPYDAKAPGAPRWNAELFRARTIRPSTWQAQYDRAAHRLDLVPAFPDGAMDPSQPAALRRWRGR